MNINWQRCVLNIRQFGMPLRTAAIKIGRNEQWMYRFANGSAKEPFFSDGLKPLDLHEQLCGPDKTRELLQ